ncbi:RNA methyltransferase [Erysipelothrix urinaevulpis]|uniref:TrmH family RNA methyltransferase n=1 Tax=Erysipelothrix urinaevulpis TaxID=2683717 RepID=UPI00135A429E|nr:TrmH family RNA methyltransferase [Erysipelothrix urinaevulpis]
MIVSGKISVKAIIENKKREIKRVILLKDMRNKDVAYILRIANGMRIDYLSREEIDRLADNTSHGGYAIECGKRISDSIQTLDHDKNLALMCVEGLRDPFNLGEVLRTVHSLGFDGVISSDYDFYVHEAKLIRASAGASEKLWWLQSEDVAQDLNKIKQLDVRMIAAHRDDKSTSLQNYVIPKRSCFVLGGALRGLSRVVRDSCDDTVRIDYNAKTSLSTVGACTVFAYESFRQRGGHHED